jgi:hypothetical protein
MSDEVSITRSFSASGADLKAALAERERRDKRWLQIADDLTIFHDELALPDGRIRIWRETEQEQTRLNLRAALREAAEALREAVG